MGASSSSATNKGVVDAYPIRLTAEQSVAVHGFSRARTTLTWRDFQRGGLTLAHCACLGISVAKLHRMQPDPREWIAYGGATLFDCALMEPWAPNPFADFGARLGDLVLHRRHVPPAVLVRAGVTVADLRARHGLTGELMAMLHYAPEDWFDLGLRAEDLDMLSEQQWPRVFGETARSQVERQLSARRS